MINFIKRLFLFAILISSPSVFALETRLIIVTGDAEVRVDPDEVILTLGVETWDKQLNVAKKENDMRIQKIIDVAIKYKIEEKYIQTDFFRIEPRYEDSYQHRKFIDYNVRNTLVITLREITKFEDVLSGVLDAGANYVHGINFRTTELRKYRDQARSLAIKAAKDKANMLAQELGGEIGVPYNIRENNSRWWSGYNSGWGSRSGRMLSQNITSSRSGSSQTDGAIALGQITVNASVSVSFELK